MVRGRQKGNQFDGIEPDTQTPSNRKFIGHPDNPWNEVHANSGCFQSLLLGSTVVSGVISYEEAQFIGNLDGSSNSYLIFHQLGTTYVDVSVYDNSNNYVVPNNINLIDNNNLLIEFVGVQSGKVLIQRGKN